MSNNDINPSFPALEALASSPIRGSNVASDRSGPAASVLASFQSFPSVLPPFQLSNKTINEMAASLLAGVGSAQRPITLDEDDEPSSSSEDEIMVSPQEEQDAIIDDDENDILVSPSEDARETVEISDESESSESEAEEAASVTSEEEQGQVEEAPEIIHQKEEVPSEVKAEASSDDRVASVDSLSSPLDIAMLSPSDEVPPLSQFVIEIPITNPKVYGVKASAVSNKELLDSLASLADTTDGIKDQESLNAFLRIVWPVKTLKQRRLVTKILMATTRDVLTASKQTRIPELLYKWLRTATQEVKQKQVETSIPLLTDILKLLLRYPVDLELLRQYKLGHVVKLLCDVEDENVKTIAASLMKRWWELARPSGSAPTPVLGKRDAESQPSATGDQGPEPVAKKPKPGSLSDAYAKKKQIAAAKMAQSVDMSSMFQTEDKPKKRPSTQFVSIDDILKPSAPKPLGTEIKPKIVGSNDSISSTISSGAKSTVSTVSSIGETRPVEVKLGKNGRPLKKVTWAPPGKLARIRFFESDAIDRAARIGPRENDKNSNEGAAMRRQIPEEPEPVFADWKLPKKIYIEKPITVESEAAKEQAIREKTALSAPFYLVASDIPPSPAEPDPEPVDQRFKPKIICLDKPAGKNEEPSSLASIPMFNSNMMTNLISSVATQILTAPSSQPHPSSFQQHVPMMQHVPRPSFVNQPPQFGYRPPVMNQPPIGMYQPPPHVPARPAYRPLNGMPMPNVRPSAQMPYPGPSFHQSGAGWPKHHPSKKHKNR